MARIRTIKPEYWTDEAVGEVSIPARLLLVGALNFADDHGGLDRSSKQLKAQVFPYDSIDCEPLVLELIRARLLIEYQVADCKYLHIKGFQKHQKVDHPSKFPKTPAYSENTLTNSSNTLDESGKEKNTHGVLASPREESLSNHTHRGMEGKVGEGNTQIACARDENVPCETLSEPATREFVDAIKAIYPKAARADWITAEKLIRNLLRDGVTRHEIHAGVKRYAAYCQATHRLVQNPAGWFGAVDRPWRQDWDLPPSKAEARLGGNLSAAEEFMRRTEPVK